MKNILLGIIAILVIGGLAVWALMQPPATTSVSNADDTAIRTQVTEFGAKLKNVSLLASSTQVKNEMDQNYGAYLSSSLLAAWEADPSQALGRQTSSPWPERIEMASVTQVTPTTYTVEANVIEVTNASPTSTEPAAVYPVTLTLEKQNDTWLITAASKGAYSTLPERKTLTGVWECLPHVGSGPTTLECAFGIKEDSTGDHYAVSTSLMSSGPVDYATNTRVRIVGIVVPKEQLNSYEFQKYDIVGVISATSITEL